MALPVWGQPQFLQGSVYQNLVRVPDAEGALRLHAFGEQLVVHVLHHHVGLLQPFPALHRPATPLELTVTVLVEPAQSPGECGLSSPIVAHHADDLSPSGGKADPVKDGAPLIAQGDIVQRQHRSPDRGMAGRREDVHQIRCPQPHLFPLCLGQPTELFRCEYPFDLSSVQIHDPVCYVHQVIEPVLCDQDGLALALDQPQMLPQFLDGGHVQVRRWFIQQIDLRVHGVDGCECDLLLFPAGQLEDIAAAKALDAQILRRLLHALRQFLGRPGLILDAEGDLAVRVHVKKLRSGILEH